MKKRLLFCTEHSALNSGYGTYAKKLLTSLYETEKYEIAELAAYCGPKEAVKGDVPWKVYWNKPEEGGPEWNSYKGKEINQFGAFKFETAALDFKPDVVLGFRDIWMDMFEYYSPLRPFYSWIIMPPIDSFPLKDEFMEIYKSADGLLTYNEWAKEETEKYTNGRLKVDGVGKYAIEGCYAPIEDRAKLRESWGFSPDTTVFGSVMRNQVRKQIPDLLRGFADFLKVVQEPSKYVLWLHTSYPDKQAWDIPSLLAEFDLPGNVYFSYICKNCKHVFAAPFSDARSMCRRCRTNSAVLPNVQLGYTVEQLSQLYNILDLYVQASNCEGFGFPILEAAFCGTPIACVDHSGMKQLNKDLKGYSIRIAKHARMIEGNVDRAYIDNLSLVDALTRFSKLRPNQREKRRKDVLGLAKANYKWENVVKTWENVIDNVRPAEKDWNAPPVHYNLQPQVPPNLSNREYMDWLYDNVLMEPEKKFSSFGASTVNDLVYGVSCEEGGKEPKPFDREKILKVFLEIAKFKQIIEIMRVKQ